MKKKYSLIYADPPWQYKVWRKNGSVAENHYSTMHLQDICSLRVQDIASENCCLFLWATMPLLQEAMQVINSWGFIHKTVAFVWVKRNKKQGSWFWGLGHYTRSNAELCLLATKGSIRRMSAKVHQIIDTHIEEHSKKPDIAREKIVELFGGLPRIELFARQEVTGWDCWGNEVLSDIALE